MSRGSARLWEHRTRGHYLRHVRGELVHAAGCTFGNCATKHALDAEELAELRAMAKEGLKVPRSLRWALEEK